MSVDAPAAKHKPPIVDGKLWKAARILYLRDGTQVEVSRVAHVDAHHLVVLAVGSDEPLLIPKHSVDKATLHRERLMRAGEG